MATGRSPFSSASSSSGRFARARLQLEVITMELPDLPAFPTVPQVKRSTRFDRAIDQAIERGALHVIRTSPNGWRRLDVEDVRRWLKTLGPNGPRDLPARTQ